MPLHPDAVVVRGGLATKGSVIKALQVARQQKKGNVLSVRADTECTDNGAGLTLEDLCAGLRQNMVRKSTVGKLEAAGISLVHTPSGGHFAHYTAELPDPVEQSIEAFIGCFDAPEPNPAKETEQST